jgi:hypothetical protein
LNREGTKDAKERSLRTIVFWSYLTAGVIAGVVILVMSVTGVLLTYERQLIAWSLASSAT